jgi:hypothetical protein
VIQRRAVAGIVLAIAMSMLAACGFESPAVEDHEQASVQASDFSVGALKLADTSIVEATTTSAAPQFYLVVTIVNDSSAPDTLASVTTTQGTITLGGTGATGGQLTLPPGVPVEIDVPSAGGPTLSVAASPTPQTGAFVPVVFNFATAGPSATIQVPVVPVGETTGPTQPLPTGTASVPTTVGDTASD